MDLPDDEIDIQLRSNGDVGRRMIALAAVAIRIGALEGSDASDDGEDDEEVDDDVEDRFDWLAWLADHRLLDALTPAEVRLLHAADDDMHPDDLDNSSAAAESLGALAWAARRAAPTVLDRGYDYAALIATVPSPWDDPSSFLSKIELRTEAEIAAARDAAEVFAWRSVAEVERRAANSRDRADVEAAIRDVAQEAAGIVPIGRDGDLLIGGESMRTVSESLLASMVAASHARLRAVNWLCGLGAWDDPGLIDL